MIDLIILIILAFAFVVVNAIMFVDNNDGIENRLRETIYILTLSFIVICSLAIGIFTQKIESKKELKPTLKINCVDSKCDTTYVYQEK